MHFPFYVFAWIASVVYGAEVVLMKLTSKHSIANPWLFNFLWTALVVLFTVPVAISFHPALPVDWTSVMVAAIFYALVGILLTHTLYKLDVSVLGPLFNIRTVFSVFLGVLLLGETLTSMQYVYILVILLCGIGVSIDEKFRFVSFFRKDILFALVTFFMISVWNVTVNKALVKNDFWTVTLWMQSIGLLLLCGTIPLFWQDVKKLRLVHTMYLAPSSFVEVVANFAAYRAYQENVSISSTIIALPFSLLMTIGLSVIAPTLLEKHSWKVYAVRLMATAVMIGAALQLSH